MARIEIGDIMKLIINADDFGFCRSINYGIVDAHSMGILSSTTLMVTMPGAAHAAELMQEYPNLGVGLHLNFALGKPLTSGKSLVDQSGNMMKPSQLSSNYQYDYDDVYAEINAQYEAFVRLTAQKPTHMDTHLFTSEKIDVIKKACIAFATEKNIPMRAEQINNYPRVKFESHHNYGVPAKLDYIYDYLDEILNAPYVELMVHPGYVEDYLLKISSYAIQRTEEVAFLIDSKNRDLLKQKGVEIISYAQLSKK